jgi:argininosuccinate synthase
VPVEEYWDLALNGVTLEPGKVVLNAGSPTVTKALKQHNVEVIEVDFSEGHRFAIAGLHCATSSSSAIKGAARRGSVLGVVRLDAKLRHVGQHKALGKGSV